MNDPNFHAKAGSCGTTGNRGTVSRNRKSKQNEVMKLIFQELQNIINDFMKTVLENKIDIYNEFSFQHELGIYLREKIDTDEYII
jgi:hypothetical protein